MSSQHPEYSERAVGTDDGAISLAGEVRALFHTLLSRAHVIVIVAILTMVAVLAYIWITTPLFSATVEILIDPRERQTVGREVTPSGLGSSAVGADTLLLESQIEVLKSQKVADALINWENLTTDPEFAGAEGPALMQLLKNLAKTVVYGPQDSHWKSQTPYDRVLANLKKRVDIERKRNTYVISVTVRSDNAEKAARLANRIAWIYISEVNHSASARTREASKILDSKLHELRNAANRTAAAVEVYKQEKNLVDANQTLLIEQQLGDLNRALSAAKSEIETTRARRNQVQAAIESGDGSTIRPGEIGISAVMSQLQTRLADLEAQEAALRSVYLTSHPTIRGVRERISAVKASLRQEYSRILNRLDVEFKTAREKTNSLQREVAKLEGQMGASNSDKVQMRELEREALAARTIYENFLQRSKEAREQIDIPSSTAVVISRAIAPSKPSEPNVKLLLLAGTGLGLSLGIMTALLLAALGAPARLIGNDPIDSVPEGSPEGAVEAKGLIPETVPSISAADAPARAQAQTPASEHSSQPGMTGPKEFSRHSRAHLGQAHPAAEADQAKQTHAAAVIQSHGRTSRTAQTPPQHIPARHNPTALRAQQIFDAASNKVSG